MVLHARRIVLARFPLDAGKTGNDNEKLRRSELLGVYLAGRSCSYDGINEPTRPVILGPFVFSVGRRKNSQASEYVPRTNLLVSKNFVATRNTHSR